MGEVELKIVPDRTLQEKYHLISKRDKASKIGISTRTIDRWVLQDKIKYTYLPNSKRKWFFKDK